ncbi:MAG: ABC-2 family transporter protein [Bdellovibrio sp.]|nr:ABC-2 family transporter protein [Bdellovibrio sp.]
MNTRFFQFFRRCSPFAKNAARLIIIDRGMFVADFFLATTVPFVMQFLIWTFIYSGTGIKTLGSMGLRQTIYYYAFAIAFGRLNNGYDIVSNLSQSVREGSLEPHLLRPLSYPMQKISDFMGGGLVYTVPIIIILCVFLNSSLVLPTPLFWPGWILMLISSQILCFTISWMVGMTSFWLVRTNFVLTLLTTSAAFFGGELLPAHLWGDWLRPLMSFNPLRFMISAPAEAIVTMDINFLWNSLLYTWGYTLFFATIARFLWKRGMKRYRGAGG